MQEQSQSSRPRLRELGLRPGIYPPGPANAIVDVAGVRVGHVTVVQGDDVRTGVTVILPHGGNLFQEKVPAAVVVGNGFGKLMGSTQVNELGELETPIALTNTLTVPRAADALIEWTLAMPGNESVRSVNPVVGETNDGVLNAIRRRVLTPEHTLAALKAASEDDVQEGCVGAGTGVVAFGWKGGIGTSSRVLPQDAGGGVIGVLVQSNFGGELQILGTPVGNAERGADGTPVGEHKPDGSIMIVVATDLPLSHRNLTRLANRALAGLARTGAAMSNGSGDYVIAFSTHPEVRRTPARRAQISPFLDVPNDRMSPAFQACIEATEEAILNSLLAATTMTGNGHTIQALPPDHIPARA